VVSALNAQDPAAAGQFNASPEAQDSLRTFLASPPDQRQQMVQQAESTPQVQQYVPLVQQVANTCNNY
jgi:hemophore-related protein